MASGKKLGLGRMPQKPYRLMLTGTVGRITATSEVNGDEMKGSFEGTLFSDSTENTALAHFTGQVVDNRITFHSTP